MTLEQSPLSISWARSLTHIQSQLRLGADPCVLSRCERRLYTWCFHVNILSISLRKQKIRVINWDGKRRRSDHLWLLGARHHILTWQTHQNKTPLRSVSCCRFISSCLIRSSFTFSGLVLQSVSADMKGALRVFLRKHRLHFKRQRVSTN